MQTTLIRVSNKEHHLFGVVLRVWIETNAGLHVRNRGEDFVISADDVIRCVQNLSVSD